MKKTIIVLLVLLTLLALVPSASYADSGYTEAYDSFIVSEEYRTMAEEAEFLTKLAEYIT